MKKESYLIALKKSMEENGYNDEYISLCIKYATRLIENNLPVIFDIKHLSLLLGVNSKKMNSMLFGNDSYYNKYDIPKKSGGNRTIYAPKKELKYVQRWILVEILNKIRISEFATGFTRGKSIIDNAKIHLNQECVFNIDIKDFFPSINFFKVYKIFRYYGYTEEVSFLLSKLCTLHDRLPQGSPASPALSNIVCLKLDKRLHCLAQS